MAWVKRLLDRAAILEEQAVLIGVGRAVSLVWAGQARDAYDARAGREASLWMAWCSDLRALARVGEVCAQGGDAAEGVLREALSRVSAAPYLSTKTYVKPTVEMQRDVSALLARDVRGWWQELSEEERLRYEALAGASLGPLAGLPIAVRDRVNRVSLAQDAHRRDPLGTGVQRRRRAVSDALVSRSGDRPVLIEYDLMAHRGDGTVVVGLGDVESAPRLTVMVTGLGSEAEQAPRRIDDLQALREASGDVPGTAAVWWLDQDAPDGPTDRAALTVRRAAEGGTELMRDLAGVEAVRPGDGRTSLWGHSYGSTTVAAGLAGASVAQRDAAGVDAVGLVGSPGAGPARTAADLGVGEVYALKDSRDLVAGLGAEREAPRGTLGAIRNHVGLGIDPTAAGFGAVVLPAERDEPGLPGVGRQHSSYFDPGSESLRAMGDVVRGPEASPGGERRQER